MKDIGKIFLLAGAFALAGAGCLGGGTQEQSLDDFLAENADILSELEVKNIDATVMEPGTVTSGEQFTFGVTVTNEDTENRSIRSIDISRSFLDGMQVVAVQPTPDREYYVDALDQDIFELNVDVAPGQTQIVNFDAVAGDAGSYEGDLDICIDSDVACIFDSISIVVE